MAAVVPCSVTLLYNPDSKKAAKRADPFWHMRKWKQYKQQRFSATVPPP